MATTAQATPSRIRGDVSHDQRLRLLGVLVAASIISTGLHYTHNYIAIDHYPQSSLISNEMTRWGIVIVWPLCTAAGLLGLWLFSRRQYGRAAACLVVASLAGIITPGHFTAGSPHIAPFWYATIFTDAIFGLALLAFAHWTWVTSRAAEASVPGD